MIQQILSESEWANSLTAEDLRALTPLVYPHVNPYGAFNLNLNERLLIEPPLRSKKSGVDFRSYFAPGDTNVDTAGEFIFEA